MSNANTAALRKTLEEAFAISYCISSLQEMAKEEDGKNALPAAAYAHALEYLLSPLAEKLSSMEQLLD